MLWIGHGGWGFFLGGLGWMLGSGLLTLLFWGAMIGLVVLALRSRRAYPLQPARGEALDVLNARYARGEISRAEYEQIRQDISR